MKEQKISIGMKDYTNYPKGEHCNSLKNSPVASKSLLLFHFRIGLALLVHLLYSVLAVIGSLYFITNRTVSNKIANIWSICGPVFKTFA